MSKFPEYKHEKSQEWFNRALNAIPSGVYGHLGPSEGLFLPITKWPLMSQKAKGTYFWDVDGNKYLDFMCAYGPNVLGSSVRYTVPFGLGSDLLILRVGSCRLITRAPLLGM